MLEIKDHHIANEIVKFIKKYFINCKKNMKRLQLIVFKRKKKTNRNIRVIIVYILNDFKRARNKTYFKFFASTRDDFRAANLIINNIKLIKNSQTNASFDDDFVENFSIIISRIDIIKTDTSTFLTRAIVFKLTISKIVSVISRKILQFENINYFSESSIVSSAASFISF